jgi:hypothetical protein
MTRRLLPLTLLTLTTLAGAAGTVTLKSAAMPYTVAVPAGWIGLNLKDGLAGVNVASAPKQPAALMRFNFIPKKNGPVVLVNEFAAFEGSVRQAGGTLVRTAERAVGYGGVAGLQRDYTLTQKLNNTPVALKMRVWFGNGARNFYSFQLTDRAENYARTLPLFQASLDSVRF